MGLDGRIALVSSAARGIGRAIALALASDGADVGLIDIDAGGRGDGRGRARPGRCAVRRARQAVCFYFFLPDPNDGCQPDAAPF